MECIIDVDMISGYHHLGGEGAAPLISKLDNNHVQCRSCACNGSTFLHTVYNCHEKKTSIVPV